MFGSRAANRGWQFSGICGDGGGGGAAAAAVSAHGPYEETDLPILGDYVQANDPAVCVQSDDDDDEDEEYQVESRSSAKVKASVYSSHLNSFLACSSDRPQKASVHGLGF